MGGGEEALRAEKKSLIRKEHIGECRNITVMDMGCVYLAC